MSLPPLPAAQSPTSRASAKQHTAGSAAILLMCSAIASGLLGLVRIKVINQLWGAGPEQDAYQAAFKLPDLLAYFLIGGAASISLITILNRYRERGSEDGGDRALSVILTTMLVVLGGGILLGEIFAPQFLLLANKGFRAHPETLALCVHMTRIILPAQLFFFVGSVMGSRLQVRKIFIYQAFAPLIYNSGIILGALLFHRQLGVSSLAYGVLVGMFLGFGLLNSFGAFRTGLHFRPILGFRDPAFLEWLKLSLPLMIGVSLVMFDGYFLNYFASVREGGITLISNAKLLFNAPFNVIGPAAGAASLPFFASLFQQNRAHDFSASVSRAVSRLFCVGMIVSAWMIALGPWLMDLFRGGKFHRSDAAATTQLFVILAGTLALWAVQGIYARAFYAASDTKTPAITGTLITVLSAPMACAASPSHPTSASSSRPRRSPSCSIASAWSPSPTSNTPNSPAPCSPPSSPTPLLPWPRTSCRPSPPTRATSSPSPPPALPGPPPPRSPCSPPAPNSPAKSSAAANLIRKRSKAAPKDGLASSLLSSAS